jgi:hypothetical protein
MPSRTFIGRLRLPTQQDAVAELQVGSPTIPDDRVDERSVAFEAHVHLPTSPAPGHEGSILVQTLCSSG